jgi:hypothetical protein
MHHDRNNGVGHLASPHLLFQSLRTYDLPARNTAYVSAVLGNGLHAAGEVPDLYGLYAQGGRYRRERPPPRNLQAYTLGSRISADINQGKETNVDNNAKAGLILNAMIGSVIIGVIWLLMWGLPTYNVWTSSLSGKAELQKAEYTRQVAALDAQAEVARAQGVAQANKIVAEGLGGPEGYLRYLWIEKVAGSSNQIVYVPSDGGLPILEAGRLRAPMAQ